MNNMDLFTIVFAEADHTLTQIGYIDGTRT